MFWKNNWLSYHYNDGVGLKYKSTPNALWKLNIKKTIDRPIKSYHEELLLNAQVIRDSFSEPFDLLLSGGIDSELMLKSFVESKIPVNVYIARYNNNINIEDFEEALITCRIYNVTPKIIDFDLEKFVENDAYDMLKTLVYPSIGRAIIPKIIENLDNIPIVGDGINVNNFFFNSKKMKIGIHERHFCTSNYGLAVNRTIISHWHDYSPELVLSLINLNLHKWKKHKMLTPPFDLFKIDTMKYLNSNKLFNTRVRPKLIGWEISPRNYSPIDFIDKFNKKYISRESNFISYFFDFNEFANMLS